MKRIGKSNKSPPGEGQTNRYSCADLERQAGLRSEAVAAEERGFSRRLVRRESKHDSLLGSGNSHGAVAMAVVLEWSAEISRLGNRTGDPAAIR